MTLALALVIALVAAALVLEPLLRAAPGEAASAPLPLFEDGDGADDPRLVRRDRALAALKEIEFDRATAKLSDDDYQKMKAQFTAEALEALRHADSTRVDRSARPPVRPSASTDEAVERLIASARERLAAGAGAAGVAGAARPRSCLECGAVLEGRGRFCLECGAPAGSGL